jgi:hypothetical protein
MIATALQASALPSRSESCSTSSTESFMAFHLRHSHTHKVAHTRRSTSIINPIETLASLFNAFAVSSTRLVSRLPQRSASICLLALADREERAGVGSIDVLKEAASSKRVAFISALRRSKGWAMSEETFSRRTSSEGIEELRRMREFWKSLETVTSSSRLREGMENWGMEMLTPIKLVALCASAA